MSVLSVRRICARATLIAAAAVLMVANVASADTTTGTHGNYLFTDTAASVGATCVYVNDGGTARFHRMAVPAPSIWWPDSNSSVNTEHGTVGWSILLQHFDGSNWITAKQSSVQKAVAHEDSQDPYGSSTKAHLSNMRVSVNWQNYPVNSGAWRAAVKAIWYKPNGKVMGSVTHQIVNYRFKVAGEITGTTTDFCVNAG